MSTPSLVQRGLLSVVATPFIAHETPLPLLSRRLISDRARLILAFVIEFLSDAGIDADVHASGGYVRDLLLGKVSDDLDLSLCLMRCTPNVTIGKIAIAMPGFARRRPDLAIEEVDVVSALSDTARDKQIDAAQLCVTICDDTFLVDLMPTIGAETYDAADRVPRRDPRGTPESDSLRRDLTIGSMLLQVTRRAPTRRGTLRRRAALAAKRVQRWRRRAGADATADASAAASAAEAIAAAADDDAANDAADAYTVAAKAAAAASDLEFVLLDYHGGIEDVFTQVLRCPVPRDACLSEVWPAVIRTAADAELAAGLGLSVRQLTTLYTSAQDDAEEQAMNIQALWWAKMLRDDPLRLLRALRFSATLGFRVHASFWLAAPFALQAGGLDTKVSPTRKLGELRKVAKAGMPKLVDFFALAFDPPPRFSLGRAGGSADGRDGGADEARGSSAADGRSFRDALFGSARDGAADVLGAVDGEAAMLLCSHLPSELSLDASVGAVLAASVLSCSVDDPRAEAEGAAAEGAAAEGAAEKAAANDAMAFLSALSAGAEVLEAGASAGLGGSPSLPTPTLEAASRELERTCDGLCATIPMRKASLEPLAIAARLLEPLPLLGVHALFAAVTEPQAASGSLFPLGGWAGADEPSSAQRAAGWGRERQPSAPLEERAADFAVMVRLWEVLKLGSEEGGSRRPLEVGPRFVLALLGTQPAAAAVLARLEAQLSVLQAAPPLSVPGSAVAGLPEVPSHLRGQLMAQLQVLCKLRGEAPELGSAAAVRAYLQSCGGLLDKLQVEWWAVEALERGPGDEKPKWVGKELRPPYIKRR